jgi:pimeloyl-ACP methyl ester carboxylesterase
MADEAGAEQQGAGHPLDHDEFAGLVDDAAGLEITVDVLPTVRREDTHTPDGVVSSLVWGIAPEVVALHGAGLNAHAWDAVVLSLGRPVLALDLPGHGHSSWRDDGRYEPRLMAPAVVRAIERLAPGVRLIVGHSLGGLTAIALADLRDDLIGAQILVDVTPTVRTAAAEFIGTFLSGPDSFASRREIAARARAFGFRSDPAALERSVVLNTLQRPDGRWVWRHHLGQMSQSVEALGDLSSLWPSLEAFEGAVTLVRAAHGFLTDEQVVELHRRVPAAEVVTVDTGHNVGEEDPAALAAVIAGHLDRAAHDATEDG